MDLSEAFELGYVMADDLKRNDLSSLDDRRNDRMEPKQTSVLCFFTDVSLPYPAGFDRIPKSFPETLVMDSGVEYRHVFPNELVFRVAGNFKKPSINGNDDSGGIGFDRSFVASEEVDDGKEPGFFLPDCLYVLL